MRAICPAMLGEVDAVKMQSCPAYEALHDDIKMQSCPAYETLHDDIKMQSCPAYEAINDRKIKVESHNTIKNAPVTDNFQAEDKPVPKCLNLK